MKNTGGVVFFAVLFSVSLSLSTGAFAYDGKLSFVRGSVSLTAHGKTTPAQVGTAVPAGASVKTGADSGAIVKMGDGALIKLDENTQITVPGGASGHEIGLDAGGVFSQVPKQKPGMHFMIRTRSATMGVRGTRFFTSFGKQRDAGSDLWMCVNQGSVEVTSAAGKKKVLVQAGEGVVVPAGKDVTPPKKYEWTKNLNWNMDPAKGDVTDKTQIDYGKETLNQDYD